jgi:hypothetical protein
MTTSLANRSLVVSGLVIALATDACSGGHDASSVTPVLETSISRTTNGVGGLFKSRGAVLYVTTGIEVYE